MIKKFIRVALELSRLCDLGLASSLIKGDRLTFCYLGKMAMDFPGLARCSFTTHAQDLIGYPSQSRSSDRYSVLSWQNPRAAG